MTYAYISRIESGASTRSAFIDGSRPPDGSSVSALPPGYRNANKLGVSAEYLETGRAFPQSRELEERLGDAELRLRLDENPGEAERELNQLETEARAIGDVYIAHRALLALALASFRRGDAFATVERFEQAIGEQRPDPLLRPDVYGTLAQAYAALGAPERGVTVLDQCLQEVARAAPDDVQANVRYATLLSYALTDAGDLERAAELVVNALARTDAETDPYTRVRLHWSMARLAGIDGRVGESLDHIRQAIALLEVTEDNLALARAHLLAGNAQLDRAERTAAREHVGRARNLFGESPLPLDLGSLLVLEAELADDPDAAVRLARQALDTLGATNAPERAAATRALARGLALRGDVASAIEVYSTAIDLFTVHGRTADAAATCDRLARLLQEVDLNARADEVLERAQRLRATSRARTR